MSEAARSWRIEPGPLRSGAPELPGDKSITHRAILLALVAEGESTIAGGNDGADGAASLAAAEALGARVTRGSGAWRIAGVAGRPRTPDGVIDCGNSGTSLRLLAGLIAGFPIAVTLSGDDSLRRRPVDRIVAPLRAMGARVTAADGDRLPPLTVQGGSLRGSDFAAPTASAQVASCLLLAGMSADGRTTVRTLPGVRDHTLHSLRHFGVALEVEEEPHGVVRASVTGPVVPRAAEVRVPGDPSAAAFFFAAAAITPGLRIEARGVNLNPGRLGFLGALEAMGVRVEIETLASGGEPVGNIAVTGPAALHAADVGASSVPAMVDEVPAWAAVAACARGTSRLAGAGELRVKESDRLSVVAEGLRSLGIDARESPEGLAITGGRPRGGRIPTHADHRIAMAFAVLGTRAESAVEVDDATGVATSFPGFETAFLRLGGRLAAQGPA